MKRTRGFGIFPGIKSLFAVLLSAFMMAAAFPGLEWWPLAWFGLIPLFWAIDREQESLARAFILGELWGTVFFFSTCWWLTHAPITYAGFPPYLAYFLLVIFCMIAAIFPGIFALITAFLIRRLGGLAILAAPVIWVCTEFLRYLITGNNWNAVGYSQAFTRIATPFAQMGGVLLVSFLCLVFNTVLFNLMKGKDKRPDLSSVFLAVMVISMIFVAVFYREFSASEVLPGKPAGHIVAIQPNVPMAGLDLSKWRQLRQRQAEMAEAELAEFRQQTPDDGSLSTTVIFPESPMNFMYSEDREFRDFIHDFARRNNVRVIFNSAEPNRSDGKFFNSAVMVGPNGPLAQYDKIYLLPFGETIPFGLESIIPALVGTFSHGSEYDMLPLGDANAGVMICFESHFAELSRQYVLNGADAIIEMTNDGYLGDTPVLRQHLANAVFRAIETNRPVFRVTNVGITANIIGTGEILGTAPVYQEDTRVWTVPKSNGSHTIFVKFGNWFAWLCSLLTIGLLIFCISAQTSRAEKIRT